LKHLRNSLLITHSVHVMENQDYHKKSPDFDLTIKVSILPKKAVVGNFIAISLVSESQVFIQGNLR